MYSVFLEKNVIKFLEKQEKLTKERIIAKIESLKENPFPSDAKRIVNIYDKVFRIRVGKYRVLYRIEDEKIVVIFLIGKRENVYD
ncbi:MAG: type II toxin-antitoxin system RelE/ParE family toxin [archaeon]